MPNPIDLAKPDFENVLAHLSEELRTLRGGRAHAALIEHLKIEAYGSTMELKSLASISIPDAKTIQLEPWDTSLVKDIEKAILVANLGMSPAVAGTIIRLTLPQLTEENRKDIVKMAHAKGEQARIGVRTVRETVREKILKQEKDKITSEDERFRLCDILEKEVSDINKKIDAHVKKKEEDILTI